MRSSVAGLAVIALSEPVPEQLLRWVGELPPAPPDEPADVTWHRRVPSDLAATAAPHARRADGAWQCAGAGHHLPALIQDVLLARSATLLHACGLDFSGSGVVLVGRTGTGKSLATMAAVSEPHIRLLSDDVVVAESTGRVHAFPTAVAIRPYHLALLPEAVRMEHQRHARQSTALRRLARLPLARRIGRSVRRRLSRRPDGVGAWSRLVKTDYLAVPTGRLLPQRDRCSDVSVRLVVVLDNDEGADDPGIDVPDATSAALAATYENEDLDGAVTRYARTGHIDLDRHRHLALETVTRFLESAGRIVRVTVPWSPDPAAAQQFLLDAIEENLRAG